MQKDVLKIAFIGLGGRGYGILDNELLPMEDVEITAVCDVFPDRARRAAETVKTKRGYAPFESVDWRETVKRPDVDAVVIETAWEQHIQIAVAAMKEGKKAAMEVGGAYSLRDCWELVDTCESTGVDVMMLENCCYDRREMAVMNMVRSGALGDVVYARGGYLHDLRSEIAHGAENRHYRLRNYLDRNCENYPTHELGPIAKIMRINDGNRMLRLNSVASKSVGLHEYIKKEMPGSPLLDREFRQGDTVSTTITNADGTTIDLTLQTTLPRFYSRDFTIMGTRGMFCELSDSVYIDGEMNEWSCRGNADKVLKPYEHELWSDPEELRMHGHGGMDCITLRAMVESFKNDLRPPIDVYDTAAWMSISALSEQSVRLLGAPVEIPDFTRGRWKHREGIEDGKFSLKM